MGHHTESWTGPMHRRALAPVGIVGVALIGLTACGAGGASTAESETGGTPGSIDVVVESGGHRALEDIASEYKAETGTTVNLIELPYDGLFDRLSTELGSGAPSFDVAAVDAAWLSTFSGALENLDDVFTPSVQEDLFPSLLKEARVDGHFVGMPLWTNSEILFYRTDLFEDEKEKADFEERYGYPLEPPTTWQQYRDAAEFFTRDTDGDGKTDLYGTDVKGAVETEWLAFALQAGAEGTALNAEGAPIVNDRAHREALDFVTSLLPYAPPGAEQVDWGASQNLFNQGQTAMLIWWSHEYVQVPDDSPISRKVGAAPMLSGSAGIAGVPGAWYLSIPKGAEDESASADFITYVYEHNEQAIESAKSGGLGLAARVSAFESYEDKPGFEHIGPLLTTLEAPATTPRPATPQWQEIVDSVLTPALQRAIRDGGSDNQAVLDDAEQKLADMSIRIAGDE